MAEMQCCINECTFTENAPAVALTLGASELLGAAPWALWLTVVLFILGRLLHVKLYDNGKRNMAMALTQFPAAFLAVWYFYAIYIA